MFLSKFLHLKDTFSLVNNKRLAFLFGAIDVRDQSEGEANYQYRRGANSAQFNKGDIVTFTSGFLAVAGANDRPMGICDLTVLMSATNQTIAKIEVPFYPNTDEITFEMDFNNGLAAEADIGKFYQLTGATGAQKVDQTTASATVGPVCLLKLDPRVDGSTTRGLFKFAKGFDSYTVA